MQEAISSRVAWPQGLGTALLGVNKAYIQVHCHAHMWGGSCGKGVLRVWGPGGLPHKAVGGRACLARPMLTTVLTPPSPPAPLPPLLCCASAAASLPLCIETGPS